MTPRWLAGTLYDRELSLDESQRAAVQQSANLHAGRRPRFILVVIGQIVFIVVLMLLIADPMTDFVQHYVRSRWIAALLAVLPINAAYAVVCIWLLTRLYVPPMRLAMRDHGIEVCLNCGYWLRGLGDDIKSCPECGKPRSHLPTNSS